MFYKTGVYCWINSVNGKKYVGSSATDEGLRGRLKYYLSRFRKGFCHNRHLSKQLDGAGVDSYLSGSSQAGSLREDGKPLGGER